MHRLITKYFFPKHLISSHFMNESTEFHFWGFRGNGAQTRGTMRWLAGFLFLLIFFNFSGKSGLQFLLILFCSMNLFGILLLFPQVVEKFM